MTVLHEAPDQPASGSNFHQAVHLLTRRGGRVASIARALVVAAAVHELGGKAWRTGRDATQYSVSIPDTDDVYVDLQAWLVENLPSRKRRALTARTKKRSRSDEIVMPDDSGGSRPPPARVHLAYDGSRSQTVVIAGHRVKAEVERRERPSGNLSQREMEDYWRDPERLVFRCTGIAARDAVLALVEQLAVERQEQVTTRFYMANRWGNWRRRSDLPRRTLDTVILAEGQREVIAGDLERFLSDEAAYSRVGLPWHRGYVFHGPPGTGKTSLAKALAEHFELDLYFIPLSDIGEDANLLQLFADIEPRSVLVLEDVDVVHGAKSRDDAETQGVSLSGLLNALDGLATPHGLVTIMTTNTLDVLDPALLRPGRADRIEELGYLDDDQLARLVMLLTGCARPAAELHVSKVDGAQITHAAVIESAKPYLDRPRDACKAISRCVIEHHRAEAGWRR